MTGGEIGVGAMLALAIVPLVSFIKVEHWSDRVKFLVSAGVCVLAAAVQTAVMSGHLTAFVSLAGIIIASSQTFYHTYFAGTTADNKLTAAKIA